VKKYVILYIFLFSILLIGATPPSPLGFLAFASLIPFFNLINNSRLTIKNIFWIGYLSGVIWVGGTIYWISWATVPGFFGVLFYLPLFTALYFMLQKWIVGKVGEAGLFAAPFIWTAIEIIESKGEFGFTWQSIAYTQTYSPRFIQFAHFTGMYGVTFWVILINVLIYFILTAKRKKKIYASAAALLLFLIPWIYGNFTMMNKNIPVQKKIKVALVQGNIDPYKKWTKTFIDSNYVVYKDLSFSVAGQKPDLIVWPETAMPFYIRYKFSRMKQVRLITDSMNSTLLTGAPDYSWDKNGKGHPYNSAFLIKPGIMKMLSYAKMHLVPFSEYVPFRETLPFFGKLIDKLNLDTGDFSAGDSIVVFSFIPRKGNSSIKFGTVICFDSIFPDLVRKFFNKGAQFLVIITNDGWFGRTSGPFQHERIAVLRAIENRAWVVRCANTGISGFIDPYGRYVDKSSIDTRTTIVHDISTNTSLTFFTKHGLIFPNFILIISLLILLVSVFLGNAGKLLKK